MLYNFGSSPQYGSMVGARPLFNPEYFNMSEVQDEYFRTNPEAVFGAFMRGVPNTGVGSRFRDFANQWVRNLYGEYQGEVAFDPELSFMDYVRNQSPQLQQAYKSEQSTRPFTRPTRVLRRY